MVSDLIGRDTPSCKFQILSLLSLFSIIIKRRNFNQELKSLRRRLTDTILNSDPGSDTSQLSRLRRRSKTLGGVRGDPPSVGVTREGQRIRGRRTSLPTITKGHTYTARTRRRTGTRSSTRVRKPPTPSATVARELSTVLPTPTTPRPTARNQGPTRGISAPPSPT